MAIFLKRWLKAPHRIGAVAPASRFLGRAMAMQVDPAEDGWIIELGGGTGSITRALLDAGVAAQRLIVIERDEQLYHHLKLRFPQLRILHGDATQLRALLRPLGIDRVATIVSSLPLVSLPKWVRSQVIDESFRLLGDRGRFVQYTYALTSPIAMRKMGLRGWVAERVWLNLPPASVWNYHLDPVPSGRSEASPRLEPQRLRA